MGNYLKYDFNPAMIKALLMPSSVNFMATTSARTFSKFSYFHKMFVNYEAQAVDTAIV